MRTEYFLTVSNQSVTMKQKNTMSKLPNGIKVISYELSLATLRGRLLHFLLADRRDALEQTGAIDASCSIAFGHVDCHLMVVGSQA